MTGTPTTRRGSKSDKTSGEKPTSELTRKTQTTNYKLPKSKRTPMGRKPPKVAKKAQQTPPRGEGREKEQYQNTYKGQHYRKHRAHPRKWDRKCKNTNK